MTAGEVKSWSPNGGGGGHALQVTLTVEGSATMSEALAVLKGANKAGLGGFESKDSWYYLDGKDKDKYGPNNELQTGPDWKTYLPGTVQTVQASVTTSVDGMAIGTLPHIGVLKSDLAQKMPLQAGEHEFRTTSE